MTKEDFDQACEIRGKIAEIDAQEAALEKAHAAAMSRLRDKRRKVQANCKHWFETRATAEADTYCTVCGRVEDEYRRS